MIKAKMWKERRERQHDGRTRPGPNHPFEMPWLAIDFGLDHHLPVIPEGSFLLYRFWRREWFREFDVVDFIYLPQHSTRRSIRRENTIENDC